MRNLDKKTILITGATDGIGLETAKMMAAEGHKLILHGRNRGKLEAVQIELSDEYPGIEIETYQADFANLQEVRDMAKHMVTKNNGKNNDKIDVLINNAGVFVVEDEERLTDDGYDVRFSVNTIAPYILTKHVLEVMNQDGRVVNLSSAAQAPVDIDALIAHQTFSHDMAYAQSKLAIIMWGLELAAENPEGPLIVAVNPKSYLGSKMVKKAYGRQGYDLKIGADILYRAALSEEFAEANGAYYDNDYEVFAEPHPAVNDGDTRNKLMGFLEEIDKNKK